jgi:hypothetical protein
MPLKTATELLDALISATKPPRACMVSLTERRSLNTSDPNWIEAADTMDFITLTRFSSAAHNLSRQHPQVDWTGVTETDGRLRRIAKFRSKA